jgi:hypothetical protein
MCMQSHFCKPETLLVSERGTISRSTPTSSLASTQPECATCTLTHDDDLHNNGSTDAPQVWHIMHPSVTQADAISGPLAKADTLTCSNVSPHTVESKITLEAKTSVVEHIGAHRAPPAEGMERAKE